MATFYGVSSNNVNSFFASVNRASKNSASNGIYNSLGDYGLIKVGGYSKLCKAYYAKEENSSISSSDKEKADKVLAQDAVDLKNAVKSLSNLEFSEENRKKVTSGVNDFVKSYNDMISSATSSSDSKMETTMKNLTNYTKMNQNLLKQVGITVGSDNKLTVDSNVLEKASMSDLKSMFQGSSSFGGRTSQYASSIYTTAVSNYSSLYSSSGSFSSLNMSSLYDSYL